MEIKKIPHYDDYYISSCGRVFKKEKELSQSKGGYKRKYFRVTLNNKKHYVHRLVLQSFKGEAPIGFQACHNDGDTTNNILSNLRWDTPLNNSKDKIRHGTSGKGEKNAMAKIKNKEAIVISKIFPLIKTKYIANYYNIKTSSVCGIASGSIRYNENLKENYKYNKLASKFKMLQAAKENNERRKSRS